MSFRPFPKSHRTSDAQYTKILKLDEYRKQKRAERLASGIYTNTGIIRYNRNKASKWIEKQSFMPNFNVSSIAPVAQVTNLRTINKCLVCGIEFERRTSAKTCSVACSYRMWHKNAHVNSVVNYLEKRIAKVIERGKKLDANFQQLLIEHDPTLKEKECPACLNDFKERFNRQIYCSHVCRRNARQRRKRARRRERAHVVQHP